MPRLVAPTVEPSRLDVETTTDPNGRLQLTLPVGPYEIIAYNQFAW